MDAKGRESEPVCIDGEIPFEIPEGWEWARLGSLFDMQAGKNIAASNISDKADEVNRVPCFGGNGVRGYVAQPNRDGNHQIIGRQGALCGCVNYAQGPFYATEHAVVVTAFDKVEDAWTGLILRGLNLNQYATATAQPGLAVSKISEVLAPVPPLAEQRRIAERVSGLMPLVDEYGKLEEEREALDAALPERLRKSILQMAVEGMLVPQDPSDEPASVLLDRIREERARLVKEKKIKAPKGGESVIYLGSDGRRYEKRVDSKGHESEPVCVDDEIPFDIPEGWEWARLCNLADFAGGKTPLTSDKSNYADNGVLWVTSKDMKRDLIDSTIITLSEKGASSLTLFQPGTLLMVTRSGILRRLLPVAMLTKPATVNQDQKAICPFDSKISPWLLIFFKASDMFIRQNFSKAGTTVESIVFDRVKTMVVPIPPLAEQRRIVERLDSVLANTD